MRWYFFTFLLLTNVASAEGLKACTLTTYPQIYYLEESNIFANELVKDSNCPLTTQEIFAQNITALNGPIVGEHLKRALYEELDGQEITFFPEEFKVFSLEKKLATLLTLPNGWSLSKLTLLDGRKHLFLNNNQQLSVSCNNCTQLGEKNLHLTVRDIISGESSSFWASATIMARTPIYVAAHNLSVTNEALSEKDLQKAFIEAVNPEQYTWETDQLAYYKINHSIVAGTPIKRSDLSPLVLVTPGVPAEVIFISNSIRITGKALPTSRGQWGESVKMINEKNRKTIIGKVIDFNKVLVEL